MNDMNDNQIKIEMERIAAHLRGRLPVDWHVPPIYPPPRCVVYAPRNSARWQLDVDGDGWFFATMPFSGGCEVLSRGETARDVCDALIAHVKARIGEYDDRATLTRERALKGTERVDARIRRQVGGVKKKRKRKLTRARRKL